MKATPGSHRLELKAVAPTANWWCFLLFPLRVNYPYLGLAVLVRLHAIHDMLVLMHHKESHTCRSVCTLILVP